ncbi:hypothetical protein CFC21_027710 [Triticum aestivum]|uniref:CASP-like protein n=2 Tax=Triticum aestivum TaxID=4565 RepID=A0A9R1ENW1_WHEAT|nr:hypothetical protein CFC21_027710 [Triticum aestivum]
MSNRGKRCRPGMRLAQAAFAAAALAAMASTHGFASVTAFRYLIVAATVQCLWSLAVAIVDLYALLFKRSFRNARAFSILALGDWVTGAMIFSAACGSAGITVLLDNDLRSCPGNHCPNFMTATAMAFLCWFVRVPSGIVSLWWAVYEIQRS